MRLFDVPGSRKEERDMSDSAAVAALIADAAAGMHSSLIAVERNGWGSSDSIGRIPSRLLRDAPCSVLVVP